MSKSPQARALLELDVTLTRENITTKFISNLNTSKEPEWKKLVYLANAIKSFPYNEETYLEHAKEFLTPFKTGSKISKIAFSLEKSNIAKLPVFAEACKRLDLDKARSNPFEDANERKQSHIELSSAFKTNDKLDLTEILTIRDRHLQQHKTVSDDMVLEFIQKGIENNDKFDQRRNEYVDDEYGPYFNTQYYDRETNNIIINADLIPQKLINKINNETEESGYYYDKYDEKTEHNSEIESEFLADLLAQTFIDNMKVMKTEGRYMASIGCLMKDSGNIEQKLADFNSGISDTYKVDDNQKIEVDKHGNKIRLMMYTNIVSFYNGGEYYKYKGNTYTTKKDLKEALIATFLEQFIYFASYDGGAVSVVHIVSFIMWKFFAPAGGCNGSFSSPYLFNITSKFFANREDEKDRCFHHCVAYILATPAEKKTLEFTKRDYPPIAAIDDIWSNGVMDVVTANHIIGKLREMGFDKKLKLGFVKTSILGSESLMKKNDIILHNKHYFICVPPTVSISSNPKPTGILNNEELAIILTSPVIPEPDTNDEFPLYIHVPYDYECMQRDYQIPTQCGYQIPDELVQDDIRTDIFNEAGEKVDELCYKVQTTKTPGYSMFVDIITRFTKKYCKKEDKLYKIRKRVINIIFNAFNGSNYDSMILMRELLTSGLRISNKSTCFHQSKLMRIHLTVDFLPEGINIYLFDIARFTVGSLDFNANVFKIPAMKGSFDYSLIDYKENMSVENFEKLNKYLLHDVYILSKVTVILRQWFERLFKACVFDYVSLPQMTYSFWSAYYCPDSIKIPFNMKIDNFIRKSIFGGIVRNYKTTYRSPHIIESPPCPHGDCPSFKGGKCENEICNDVLVPYDVNSLYPAACLRDFPIGDPILSDFKNIPEARRHKLWNDVLVGEKLAIVSAFITKVPCEFNKKVSIFPKKCAEGLSCEHNVGEKIHITSVQLNSMIKYGYEFDVYKILYWKEKKPILAPFMDNFYRARLFAKAQKNGVMEQVIKLILNSLTGKFAQRTVTSNSTFEKDPQKVSEFIFSDKAKVLFPLEGEKCEWFFMQVEKDNVNPQKPTHLSAFLLAHSKQIMLEYMEEFEILKNNTIGPNFHHFYYMDTDSFYINRIAAMKSNFKETTFLGGMKNDLGSTDAYITWANFMGKKLYFAEKRCKSKPGIDYKISTKGVSQPKKYDGYKLKDLQSRPINKYEQELLDKILNDKQKYEDAIQYTKQRFIELQETGTTLITGQTRFLKSFKGTSPLTINVQNNVEKRLKTKSIV